MTATSLIWVTPDAEALIAYCARVSSPHQDSPNYAKLLRYCIEHKHWSVFEMANMCVEISTSRAIAQQILRHDWHFQEFSQRYAPVVDYIKYPARRQDLKNRQNSIDDMDPLTKEWWNSTQARVGSLAFDLYHEALDRGIAKEQARFILPLSTRTRLYGNTTLRNWIHYIELRTDPATQLEHRIIANEIKDIFVGQFPVISEALGWTEEEAAPEGVSP